MHINCASQHVRVGGVVKLFESTVFCFIFYFFGGAGGRWCVCVCGGVGAEKRAIVFICLGPYVRVFASEWPNVSEILQPPFIQREVRGSATNSPPNVLNRLF